LSFDVHGYWRKIKIFKNMWGMADDKDRARSARSRSKDLDERLLQWLAELYGEGKARENNSRASGASAGGLQQERLPNLVQEGANAETEHKEVQEGANALELLGVNAKTEQVGTRTYVIVDKDVIKQIADKNPPEDLPAAEILRAFLGSYIKYDREVPRPKRGEAWREYVRRVNTPRFSLKLVKIPGGERERFKLF
jgi:hypothetical protein